MIDNRRFTYVGGTSKKFWEVAPPEQVEENEWIVRVNFGRIGTGGQEHVKVFYSRWSARHYHEKKISEKLAKGYKEAGKASVKKNVVSYQPDYVPMKPDPCSHDNLSRSGNVWKCTKCKNKVEFDKGTDFNVDEIQVQVKVRRFFSKGV